MYCVYCIVILYCLSLFFFKHRTAYEMRISDWSSDVGSSDLVTGESPNTHGVCSPAKAVRRQQTPKGLESRLNGVLIDRYADGENAGYPTLCKGRFDEIGRAS